MNIDLVKCQEILEEFYRDKEIPIELYNDEDGTINAYYELTLLKVGRKLGFKTTIANDGTISITGVTKLNRTDYVLYRLINEFNIKSYMIKCSVRDKADDSDKELVFHIDGLLLDTKDTRVWLDELFSFTVADYLVNSLELMKDYLGE